MSQEDSKNGCPGALLLHQTVKAELDVQYMSKMPTLLIPAVFSGLLFLSYHRFDFPVVFHVPTGISCSTPSVGAIPELSITHICGFITHVTHICLRD